MGRDVAGFGIDKKPSMVNVKSNGTNHGSVHVAPKALPGKVEMKDYELDDHTSDEYHQKQDVLGIKSTNHDLEEKIIGAEALKSTDKKLSSPVKPASGSTGNGTIDANSSEQLTPAVEDGKQTSCADQANGAETIGSSAKFSLQDDNDVHTPKTTKKPQPNSPSVSAKQQLSQDKKFFDEEDNWSLASSTATSVRTNKSRITVPVAPKFSCKDRLERRKEYYSKLEEKHKALEKEKLDYEARTKEEEAAAIKQLRKTMVYKAHPVPSFYHEGPPPKPELKKLPVTRAKSPNLTRRKSCSDANMVQNSPEDKGLNGRAARHSVGSCKAGKSSPLTSRGKDRTGAKKLNETSKVKDQLKNHPKELKETTKNPKVKEQVDVENAVES